MNYKLLSVVVSIADTINIPLHLDAKITAAAKSQDYYGSQMMSAIRKRYEEETDDDTFLFIMALLIANQLRRAYKEGLAEVGITDWELEYENDLQQAIIKEQDFLTRLLTDIKAGIAAGLGWTYFRSRVDMWEMRYLDVTNQAMTTGGSRRDVVLEWELGATEKHCKDCGTYAGQKKTAAEWDRIYRFYGHRPQSHDLECKGYNCDCRFRVVRTKRNV